VSTFKSAETYLAYCQLVTTCWKEISNAGGQSRQFLDIGQEFCEHVIAVATWCTPESADEYLTALERAPFSALLEDEIAELKGVLRNRINAAIRDSATASDEAYRWIACAARHIGHDPTWVLESLNPIQDTSVPAHVARSGFNVLQEIAYVRKGATRGSADALWRLEKLRLRGSCDVWSQAEFRRALWQCFQPEPGPAAVTIIEDCLMQVFEQVKQDVEQFTLWVNVVCDLRKLLDSEFIAITTIPANAEAESPPARDLAHSDESHSQKGKTVSKLDQLLSRLPFVSAKRNPEPKPQQADLRQAVRPAVPLGPPKGKSYVQRQAKPVPPAPAHGIPPKRGILPFPRGRL
jgi:hypothetical protein